MALNWIKTSVTNSEITVHVIVHETKQQLKKPSILGQKINGKAKAKQSQIKTNKPSNKAY